eukprot:scaffold754_cov130-Isochrysis_galbana.AAC.4
MDFVHYFSPFDRVGGKGRVAPNYRMKMEKTADATKNGSAGAYADIRIEERSRDETQEGSGANEETRRRRRRTNADGDAVDDRRSMSSQWVPCLKNAVNENAVNRRKTCKRDSKEHGQGSRIKDHAHIN